MSRNNSLIHFAIPFLTDFSINASLSTVYNKLRGYCASRGFELLLSNLHTSSGLNLYDEQKWLDGPLEAQGSDHALSANCIAEIARQTIKGYLIPVLNLGNSLGTSLVPLTIESQDFVSTIATAGKMGEGNGKQLLEKWYCLDNKAQPACYRLKSKVDGVRVTKSVRNCATKTNLFDCRRQRKRGQRNCGSCCDCSLRSLRRT